MSDIARTLQVVTLIIAVIVGLGGLTATVWAIGRVKAIEASIEVLTHANAGLRDANQDLRVKIEHSERECSDRVSRLEGQNQALLDGLGDKLANVVGTKLEQVLGLAAARIVDGIAKRSEDRERRFNDRSSDEEEGESDD